MAETFRMRLVIGDWSMDGHNMTESITVEANRKASAVKLAYLKGSKVVGLDVTADVCRDYEDNTLLAEDLVKLVDAGFTGLGDFVLRPEMIFDDTEAVEPFDFAQYWLFIARKGDPDLRIKVVEDEEKINIGGYGLFST